ncbi:glycosyltransferase family 2 protein [Pandoraea sp. XY-2]|uniref:glycosyltransferase family 2 protein n=1 Tax=Pandoraea sp. XY-2 TaxID=2518599 RepID=UPI00101B0A0F|nr:glycosyltransferase [Pandoraea sp. XY-2]QBC33470.1 glycosyltransferase family 2 protein [Pandoraea sp. XY-2]
MKLGYVCTNYNNSAFTRTAVETLLKIAGHEFHIVVVDNASDSQNVGLLRDIQRDFPDVDVIYSQENMGYFKGLNAGIARVRELSPGLGWMAIGNNDLEFPAEFADRLERNAERLGKHLVISPDVLTLNGEHQNPHVISTISPVRELFYDLYYSNYYLGMAILKAASMLPSLSDRHDEREWQTARPIYQGHGSCYILTPAFFERFSELWAPTFMMSEEYFLSKQLSDVGEQVYYDPCVQVVHHWHASLAKLPGRRRWEMARDAHREYRKYVKVLR